MIEHLGFINKELYTDIHSMRVYKENGRVYAVDVEKVRACDPKWIPGGFVGHCYNQDQVWDTQETKDISDPFEIIERRGVWGFWKENWIALWTGGDEAHNREWAEYNNGIDPDVDYRGNEDGVFYCRKTKSGKYKKVFVKLGKIEQRCRYFYDYNF